MNVLDLFSGIGGFSLGLERAGMRTIAFCETDEFCRRVLAKHWLGVPIYGDIGELTGDGISADLVCGGPPCQQTSVAAAIHGRRDGTSKWPEMFRITRRRRPEWVLVEQPGGNAEWEAGVKNDLEGIGYTVSRHIGKACRIGAPHLRRRVFIAANRDGKRLQIAWPVGSSSFDGLAGTALAGDHWGPDNARTVRVDDGVPGGLDRRARIQALGNAVVPQVVEVIGRAIMEADKTP